eukprot:217162-Alexandrium_andersonii.AAC.1
MELSPEALRNSQELYGTPQVENDRKREKYHFSLRPLRCPLRASSRYKTWRLRKSETSCRCWLAFGAACGLWNSVNSARLAGGSPEIYGALAESSSGALE